MASKRASTVPGAYSAVEEDFFRAGASISETEEVERFEDLDEGYQPVGFWQRLFGGGRK